MIYAKDKRQQEIEERPRLMNKVKLSIWRYQDQ